MTAKKRPNILLVTTDQQRYDTVRPHAPAVVRTPHLTQLQSQGVNFTRAYADNPICVPSRISLMTGRTVGEHGMLNNGETGDLIDREESLPAQMAGLGYQTAAIGKMHFAPPRARYGFDEMLLPADYYEEQRISGSNPTPMIHGLGQNELYPTLAAVPEAETLTAWISDKASDYLLRRRDPTVPFFLWVSYSKPHPPLDPPEPYYSMYDPGCLPDPIASGWSTSERMPEALRRQRHEEQADLISPEVMQAARAAYYGLVTQVDYSFGRVLAGLSQAGLMDDTLILFTSDHGEYLGDHGLVQKVHFHEPSAHVPFILRPPRSWDVETGVEVPRAVTLADVLPTLVEAAGGTRTPSLSGAGESLLPLVFGNGSDESRYIDGMSAGYHADAAEPVWIGLTDGVWKYIWYPEGPSEQLFNLADDPNELRDLSDSSEYQTVRQELKSRLEDRHRSRGSPYVTERGLVERPVQNDSLAQRRRRGWPGYHTESHPRDTNH